MLLVVFTEIQNSIPLDVELESDLDPTYTTWNDLLNLVVKDYPASHKDDVVNGIWEMWLVKNDKVVRRYHSPTKPQETFN